MYSITQFILKSPYNNGLSANYSDWLVLWYDLDRSLTLVVVITTVTFYFFKPGFVNRF